MRSSRPQAGSMKWRASLVATIFTLARLDNSWKSSCSLMVATLPLTPSSRFTLQHRGRVCLFHPLFCTLAAPNLPPKLRRHRVFTTITEPPPTPKCT